MPDHNKVQFITIDDARSGQRIDNYLANLFRQVPKSHLYRIIRKGEVRINKKRIKADYKIQTGDILRIPPVKTAEKHQPIKLNKFDKVKQLESCILHETNQFILLNKPSGMAVHGGSGLSFGVIEALRSLRPREKFLELVHRLDRDTSGCLLIAKRRSYLTHFHQQLKDKTINKEYLALVDGVCDFDQTSVAEPLKKNQLKSGERFVSVDPSGKESLTQFVCIKRFSQHSLIKAIPATGRTHQIRVHAQYLGHPLLADTKYNLQPIDPQLKAKLAIKSFFLHAQQLTFSVPEQDELLSFQAPIPQPMTRVIDYLETSLENNN